MRTPSSNSVRCRSIYSFRSAPVVLEAVDRVFEQPAAHRGLTVDPVATVHEAVRVASPGLVELWPLVEPDEKPDVEPWDQPFDTTSETSPRVKLAKQIAAAVKEWLRRGDLVGDGDKRHPLRAGDILILVRQRGPLFEAIIRALKTADVAVAGADRLQLTEHIAIMDLLALGGRAAASAGRSGAGRRAEEPAVRHLGGRIVRARAATEGSLRAALRATMPDLGKRLDALDEESRTLSPFTFYARLLGGGARKAFLARLGAEANDALDEFLNLALAYESRQTPSLQGFVHWIRTASTEVKRDMEIARDEVRVMTVHGAKGLEAAVVVMADTTTEPAGPQIHHPKLFSLPAQNAVPGTPERIAWMPTKQDDVAAVSMARQTMILGQRERIPPPALCRDDARRRPPDRVRLGRGEEHAARLLVRSDQARPRRHRPAHRRARRRQGFDGLALPEVRVRDWQGCAARRRAGG